MRSLIHKTKVVKKKCPGDNGYPNLKKKHEMIIVWIRFQISKVLWPPHTKFIFVAHAYKNG